MDHSLISRSVTSGSWHLSNCHLTNTILKILYSMNKGESYAVTKILSWKQFLYWHSLLKIWLAMIKCYIVRFWFISLVFFKHLLCFNKLLSISTLHSIILSAKFTIYTFLYFFFLLWKRFCFILFCSLKILFYCQNY